MKTTKLQLLAGALFATTVFFAYAQVAQAQYTVSITRINGVNLNESEESGSDEVTVWVDSRQVKGAESGLTDGDNDYVRIGGSHPRNRRVNVLLFENKPNGYTATVEIREQQGTIQSDGRIGTFKVTVKDGKLSIESVKSVKEVKGRTVILNGDETDYQVTVNISD
jgi:hypothetical protein